MIDNDNATECCESDEEGEFLIDIIEQKCLNRRSFFTLEELEYIYALCQQLRKNSIFFKKHEKNE